ncbi:sterol desaturase family protein [Variovorax sp. ZS18.2.2]|uniref:sterol desaturase family protein n=1 Tax=Variovorax sp. ZS18.2.2 TaxID=2971255 RepID=UPI0021515158|nr:sterol desaturase family protein [Variovorax sp. ZS18.2.2]MCR6480410.1 sterol desaturase family protein [Variovorax sp. ZS18.2.2]
MNTPAGDIQRRVRAALPWLLWPTLYGLGLFGAGLAFASHAPLSWFNLVYLSVALVIAVLERWMPHELRWLVDDGETPCNLAHTLLTKGGAQLAAAAAASAPMAVATIVRPSAPAMFDLWPAHWPLLAQVVLALVVAELGLYFAHRSAHEWPPLWRFHALHHSVQRLWVVNTGRFHLIDSAFKAALGQIPLYLLGAPLAVFAWVGAVTAITGLLTHCNIELHTGWLDRIFSTPALHRWHHSKVLEEGNRNYGENLVLWDLLFGTYFHPPRRPPADIGIDGHVAPGFLAQLLQPLTASGVRQIMGTAPHPRRNGPSNAPGTGREHCGPDES